MEQCSQSVGRFTLVYFDTINNLIEHCVSVFLLLLLGFILHPASGGLYGPKSAVTSVNSASFDRAVLQSSLPVLVEFYAPW